MKADIRLVQLRHPQFGRKVAVVEEPSLILLADIHSIYDLALIAIKLETSIAALVENYISSSKIDYNSVYEGKNEWLLLPSFDCPPSPFGCLVSGTGLTHKNSALNRQMMHQAENATLTVTDSMKMYQWGLEGGRPKNGDIGVQPEWFYKGTGAILKAHGETLSVPAYANDGGEEPEIAGVYIIDKEGQPYRVGFTTGNEFSDHVMEKKNYLYLAPSKLRDCAIGPELVISNEFYDVDGTVRIDRNGHELWSAQIHSGEKNMAHSLANLEYHHFKYADHRQPLQAHVHFLGADAFSFGAGVRLENGDKMFVHWNKMGRPLINPIMIEEKKDEYAGVKPIGNIAWTECYSPNSQAI